MLREQRRATIISSFVASVLVVFKLVAGILSGSVTILASAVDSLLDLCVSLFNYFAIYTSQKPPNERFNYGKGKIESLACVIEGSVIAICAIFIFYESMQKIYINEEIAYMGASIGVMCACFIVTCCLVAYLSAVAKRTNNLIIKADCLHYKTDLLSNGAVLLSLGIVALSGWNLVDGIFGVLIASYILYSACGLLRDGVFMLLDRSMDEKIVQAIKDILKQSPLIVDFHGLKTRQSGEIYFVEVHLIFHNTISLMEAHTSAHKIEHEISNLQKDTQWEIITHLDPYDDILEDSHKKPRDL